MAVQKRKGTTFEKERGLLSPPPFQGATAGTETDPSGSFALVFCARRPAWLARRRFLEGRLMQSKVARVVEGVNQPLERAAMSCMCTCRRKRACRVFVDDIFAGYGC
jgi:hypothetical protein